MRATWLIALVVSAMPAFAETAVDARGGVLRWLDKVSGETGDLELSRGQSAEAGRLMVQMDDCRYPKDGSATDAYAHLTILDEISKVTVFSGWMTASSPALSSLDHSRYDVWVLRCLTE
jgi:hypothetical protein